MTFGSNFGSRRSAPDAEERVAGLENSLTFRYTGLFRKPLAAVRRPRGG